MNIFGSLIAMLGSIFQICFAIMFLYIFWSLMLFAYPLNIVGIPMFIGLCIYGWALFTAKKGN